MHLAIQSNILIGRKSGKKVKGRKTNFKTLHPLPFKLLNSLPFIITSMSLFSKKRPIWIHMPEPTNEQIHEVVEKYDLHTIVEDDLLSGMIQDKVDSYDDHLFLVTHFPKYDQTLDKYYANPLFVLITKNTIITICKSPISALKQLYDQYQQ